MAQVAVVMSQHGWLSRRPAEFRDALISRCRLRRYRAGETVYREGDPSHAIFGLVSGRWLVKVPPADTTIALAQPGYWIGEAGIFRGAERAATVIAASPSTVLYLPPAEFAVLTENAQYCRHFAANTAEALAEAIAVIGILSQPNADVRVAQRLVSLVNFQLGTHELVVQLAQADLAELCNLSRSRLAGILQDLVQRGLIRVEYRKLIVVDISGLAAFAYDDRRLWR